MLFLVWMLVLLQAWALPAYATTYYVSPSGNDGNAGTQGAPWQTLDKGVSMLFAGDTLYLRQGSYNQPIGFPSSVVIRNGTAWNNAVTVASFPGETATITQHIVFSTGVTSRYIIFDRLRLDGNSYVDTVLFFGLDTDHIRFTNGEVLNCRANCIQGGGGFHEVLNSRVHDAPDGAYGFYFWGHDSLFDNNEVYNNGGYAFHIYNSNQTNVSNNVIRNNLIYGNGLCQCHGEGNFILANGSNNLAYNNIIFGNFSGMQIGSSCIDCKIYNNTIYNNVNDGISLGTGATNTSIRNNILYNNPLGAIIDNGAVGTIASNNLTSNPSLVAPGSDWRLQAGSPARNAGTPISAVTVDYYGTARPQGGVYDIGAAEYLEGGGLPPSGNPIYLSAGGHADTPTDAGDCVTPENILTPRATLQGAVACMSVPGKTLYIRGGTYAGNLDTGGGTPITGGSDPGSPTRIEGYQAEAVTIQLPVGGSVGLFVRSVSNVSVTKLTVDAMARTGSNAFACVNASNLTVSQSTFRNSAFEVGYFAGCSNVTASQVTFHTSSTSAVIGMEGTISSLTLTQADIHTGPVQGISANVTTGSNTSLAITRSQIHGTGTGAGGAALDLGPGTGAILTNNIIDHNNAGIRIRSGATGTKVFHTALSTSTGVALQCDSGASGVAVTNTISFGNGTNAPVNNCGATLTSILTADPLWVNVATRDFHLQSTSVALDAGVTLPEVTIAIDGTQRPVGALYDQGPYEAAAIAPPPPPPARHLIWRWSGMFQ